MEKETELYLVKRIKELELENSRLAFVNASLTIKPIIQGCLEDKKANQECETKSQIKAKAFDELVKLLHLSVIGIDKKKEYRIVSPKHAKEYFIDMPIDIETFKLFMEALTCDKRD